MMKRLLSATVFSFMLVYAQAQSISSAFKHPEYQKSQEKLQQYWGCYNTYNMLSVVKLPEAYEIRLRFKYQAKNWSNYLDRAKINKKRGFKDANIIPIAHSYDGSYTSRQLKWTYVNAVIETATEGDDIVFLVTQEKESPWPVTMYATAGILWNKPSTISAEKEALTVKGESGTLKVYPASDIVDVPNNNIATPYLAFDLTKDKVGFSTGKKRSLEEIESIIEAQKKKYHEEANAYSPNDLNVAFEAINTVMAFNSIFDPANKRVVTTVSRNWNEDRGGYAFFGWDNFFLAYMAALNNKDLAYANVIEHFKDKTEEGFIPNCAQGNGRKTWDRSQPPVGSIIVKEIYKKYKEPWFLEAVFEDLWVWNNWWMKRRLNGELLSWGSHNGKNPYRDTRFNDLGAAALETGLDDSPMYIDVPFDKEKGIMLLHDVGLNSLYIADCEALAEIASVIGKKEEAKALTKRAKELKKNMGLLWDEKSGMFVNKRTDNDHFVRRFSPTLFYPFMVDYPNKKQSASMLNSYFYNENEFWGPWVLPSISKSDETYESQKYWRGAIWAPLNFLTYISLKNGEQDKAANDLAIKSLALFVKEWKRMKFVSENYSSISGNGDDPNIKSDRFYTWGGLLGIIGMMEYEKLPNPAEPISK